MKLLYYFFIFGLLSISCTTKDMALDRNNLDTETRPEINFYQYANGGWMRNNPIPPEFSRYGSFDVLAEKSMYMVKELIESATEEITTKASIDQKVGDYYKAGMDSAAIEKMGLEPLLTELENVQSAENIQQIQNIITRWHKNGMGLLFSFYSAPDRTNSEMVIANIYQGGLGLTDVEYYTSNDDNSVKTREEYSKYVSRMFSLIGNSQDLSLAKARIVLKMEARLAEASMTLLERRDPYLSFNKMEVSKLQDMAPGYNWNAFFYDSPQFTELNVGQPEFFKEVSTMFQDEPLDNWKVYLSWQIVNKSAEYLSSEFVNAHFDFYGRFLSGKQENQPRWKRVLRFADAAMGEAIGQMYVDKYFPEEAKIRMQKLVSNLKLALGERIMALEWMSEGTKSEAMAKLEKINVKIGYPDVWRDYSGLDISADSFFINVINSSRFNYNYHISKIGKPVDPNEWGMTPQTVNAYYSPSRNEIVFPAGILQPPFFYMEADDAVNYGAIGMVIGHEMTHGFDDKGRQYDKNGNLRDWWTNEDAERFTQRAQVLIDQYDNFKVNGDIKANGKLTLGENIADLGGLNISFTALRKAWEENPPAQKINGFSPEQRFFLAYAHVWAQNITEAEILRRIREDVHSLGIFRVNGPLPHMPEFYETFEVNESAPMYIKPEKRAVIW